MCSYIHEPTCCLLAAQLYSSQLDDDLHDEVQYPSMLAKVDDEPSLDAFSDPETSHTVCSGKKAKMALPLVGSTSYDSTMTTFHLEEEAMVQ